MTYCKHTYYSLYTYLTLINFIPNILERGIAHILDYVKKFVKEGSLNGTFNLMILYSGTMDILYPEMDANPRSSLNNRISNRY